MWSYLYSFSSWKCYVLSFGVWIPKCRDRGKDRSWGVYWKNNVSMKKCKRLEVVAEGWLALQVRWQIDQQIHRGWAPEKQQHWRLQARHTGKLYTGKKLRSVHTLNNKRWKLKEAWVSHKKLWRTRESSRTHSYRLQRDNLAQEWCLDQAFMAGVITDEHQVYLIVKAPLSQPHPQLSWSLLNFILQNYKYSTSSNKVQPVPKCKHL